MGWNQQRRERLVREWKQSGLTAQQFGAQRGIAAKQLYNWSSRLKRGGTQRRATPSNEIRLLRVDVAGRQRERGVVVGDRSGPPMATLELTAEGSVRVTFPMDADPRAVATLVAMLRGTLC